MLFSFTKKGETKYMKRKCIKEFENMEKIHEKYFIYCDMKKRIVVENISDNGASGPFIYLPRDGLTEIFGWDKSNPDEKLLVIDLSLDSLKPGDFFIYGDEVYCLVKIREKLRAQICDYTGKFVYFPSDTVIKQIKIASDMPDTILDKIYNLFFE